jgi:HAE1 family hydrophobic/amphiphilic exporter-1
MFSDFFISRPIFASVASLFILLAGLLSLPSLPIAQFPRVSPPQVKVTANYPGANSEVMESSVIYPLEQQINGVEGLKYMTSSSSGAGNGNITVTFDLEQNEDQATVNVQNKVSQAQGKLPSDVLSQGVIVEKTSPSMLMVLTFYSPNNTYDNEFISNYVDRFVIDNLKRIKGVGAINVFGERKYAMRLWLNPDRLAANAITASEVLNAIKEQNMLVPGGQIGGPPALPNQPYQFSINAKGRLPSAEAFDNLVLKTNANGQIIRIKDVGRSEVGAENYTIDMEYNRKRSVGLVVYQLASANAIDVDNGLRRQLETLSKSFPPGLKYDITVNTTDFVRESINEVLHTLLEAVVLVVIVIFAFLKRPKTTLIPILTIPVSLVGTFLFMKLFGFSINTLSLFGLTLATGLVVDDAIIVVENIERVWHEKKCSLLEAAQEGTREIFSALIATSLVLIAVFVPVAFMPGTAGQFFKQFALTIAASIGISAFVALTLTPALSLIFLKETPEKKPLPGFQFLKAALDQFFVVFDGAISWLQEGVATVIALGLRLKVLTLGLFIGILVLCGLIFKVVPMGFVPTEDQNYIMVIAQAPDGVSLGYLRNQLHAVDALIKKQPEVMGVVSIGGYSFTGQVPNSALLFVPLKPMHERHGDAHSAKALVERLQAKFFAFDKLLLIPMEPPPVQGFSNTGGFQFQLLDLLNREPQEYSQILQSLITSMNADDTLTRAYSGFSANYPQMNVNFDREKINTLNVPMSDVFQALRVFMASTYINDFDYVGRSYRVYAQADTPYRASSDALGRFYVRSNTQALLPLSNFVTLNQVTGAENLTHFNVFRAAEVSGAPRPGFSMGQAIDAVEAIAQKTLPQGMRIEWTGIALEQLQSGSAIVVIFALGFLCVFMILAAQYESLIDPFIVMLAVPAAVMGALLTQGLRGLENDIFCQIGLVMLVGLAAKNAILIVEFANQQRALGHSLEEAAISAAKTRLRPILMTSFAFILGLLPLALASGAGCFSRQSLGTAVVGGMVISTILGILTTPVLYVIIHSLFGRLQRRTIEASSKSSET